MNFIKLNDEAKLPSIYNEYSPALALYCQDDLTLPSEITTVVPLGISLELNEQNLDRLGKQGAFMIELPFWLRQYGLTSFGFTVFSLDYKDEWKIVLSNQGKQNVSFKKHDIIALCLWFEHGLSHPMFDELRINKNGSSSEV